MDPLQYAIVAYLRDPVGEFVEGLRAEVQPKHAHLPAHISVLPPRALRGTEAEALESMEYVCQGIQPFEVSLGEVATFLPLTPTVFIRVAHAAYRMRELHDRLNVGPLHADEPWPYMPHLTIAKMDTAEGHPSSGGGEAALGELPVHAPGGGGRVDLRPASGNGPLARHRACSARTKPAPTR